MLRPNIKKSLLLPTDWWIEMQGVSLAELVSTLLAGSVTLDGENKDSWLDKKAEVEYFLQDFCNAGLLRVETPWEKDTLVFPTSALQLVEAAAQRTPQQPVRGRFRTLFAGMFIKVAQFVVTSLSNFLALLAGGGLLLWLAEKVEKK